MLQQKTPRARVQPGLRLLHDHDAPYGLARADIRQHEHLFHPRAESLEIQGDAR